MFGFKLQHLGDDCTLLENRDLLQWRVRGMDGVEAYVPSVVFRIPPPDPRLSTLVSRINAQFEKLRKLWDHKHRMYVFVCHNFLKTYILFTLKDPLQHGSEHNANSSKLER